MEEFEDDLWDIAGSKFGTAEVYQHIVESDEWSGVRVGLRRFLDQVRKDAAAAGLPAERVAAELHALGALERAVSLLGENATSEAARGYRVACALALALKAVVGRLPMVSVPKPPVDLVHCVYCSASVDRAVSPAALQELLQSCRRNNERAGVTGMLLYDAGSFFQVLEGDRPVIEALFAKIAVDRRHTRVKKLIVEPIPARSFGAWSMGCPAVTARELQDIPGVNDFFRQGRTYSELGAGRAKTLLQAFKEGKWRTAIT